MFSVEHFTFNLLQWSCHLPYNSLSDAVSRLLLLLLHLLQISPQNVLLWDSAFLSPPLPFLLSQLLLLSQSGQNFLLCSQKKCPISVFGLVFFCPQDFARTTIESLHDVYSTDMRYYITSLQKTHLTAAEDLLEQWNRR